MSGGREESGPNAPGPRGAGQPARPRRRNDLFRGARLAIPSPSGSGGPMSRAELAEAVNAYLWNRGVRECLSESDIGRYERGESRWPRAHRRQGLRAVLVQAAIRSQRA